MQINYTNLDQQQLGASGVFPGQSVAIKLNPEQDFLLDKIVIKAQGFNNNKPLILNLVELETKTSLRNWSIFPQELQLHELSTEEIPIEAENDYLLLAQSEGYYQWQLAFNQNDNNLSNILLSNGNNNFINNNLPISPMVEFQGVTTTAVPWEFSSATSLVTFFVVIAIFLYTRGKHKKL